MGIHTIAVLVDLHSEGSECSVEQEIWRNKKGTLGYIVAMARWTVLMNVGLFPPLELLLRCSKERLYCHYSGSVNVFCQLEGGRGRSSPYMYKIEWYQMESTNYSEERTMGW